MYIIASTINHRHDHKYAPPYNKKNVIIKHLIRKTKINVRKLIFKMCDFEFHNGIIMELFLTFNSPSYVCLAPW